MVPLTPNTVTIVRPAGTGGDADDTATTPTTIAAGLAVAIVSPNGADAVTGGQKEIVDAVLLAPTTPELEHVDLVTDDDTDQDYRVVWVRRRRGLGLDHQVAGLRAVTGGASA